ncbi:MAG: sortase, partial [Clostridia bacterium]
MKKFLFFKIMLFVALFGLILFSALFTLYIYNVSQKDKLSENLAQSFSLSYLYSNSSSYSTNLNNTQAASKTESFVIGIIKIDKLKLDYPILSSVSDELLEVAPCRFAGPMPNEIGNLCIAGHNYIDNTFFAKISTLENGDEINIYGINGDLKIYSVYDKKEIDSSDFSCTSQETGGKRIITL